MVQKIRPRIQLWKNIKIPHWFLPGCPETEKIHLSTLILVIRLSIGSAGCPNQVPGRYSSENQSRKKGIMIATFKDILLV